jgi:V/A-type H+-transporting ATPase subunit K
VDEPRKKLKLQITLSIIMLSAVLAIIGSVFCTGAFAAGNESDTDQSQLQKSSAEVIKFALVAAAIAFGLGAVGAGIAISHVGAAAMGAVAEKPQIAGQALIFVALAEGIVVFGFITALMILGKV